MDGRRLGDEFLAEEFLARLLGFIRRRVRSDADAEDLRQEVLLRLVERGGDVREGSIPAWLFTVARRAIVDRARAARAPAELPAADAVAAAANERDATAELARCLEPILARLPAPERELLRRVDAEGESQASIARALGASPSTVKSRVQRARARLRAELAACCEIALDARGALRDFTPRRGAPCPCEGECAPGE